MEIKTVGDLKKALESYNPDLAVRMVINKGLYDQFFPHPRLNLSESQDVGTCLLIEESDLGNL